MSRRNYVYLIKYLKSVLVFAFIVVCFCYHKIKIKSVEETVLEWNSKKHITPSKDISQIKINLQPTVRLIYWINKHYLFILFLFDRILFNVKSINTPFPVRITIY